MTAQAAHLVDAVLPPVAVRQWVLTFPYRLRYVLAWDHQLCRAVLRVYIRALLGFHRRRARCLGVRAGQGGAVTVIQRFGGGLQLNLHLHTLVLEGVFFESAAGALRFQPLAAPTDTEVARLLATLHRRILRLLCRRGVDTEAAADVGLDPLAEESAALAAVASASIQGRVATGPRAGARVLRIGRNRDAPWVTSRGARQAHLEGFDLHADVVVPAGDRPRVEQLCRYVLRPPLAQDRLTITPDGRALVTLKAPWHDGTTHLLFEPVELLEKLAALTPRPRINLLLYHGVLAPHARWRARVVAYGVAHAATDAPSAEEMRRASAGVERRHWRWADLMRRAFEIDVLACPRCGGRMVLIATIEDPAVVQRILTHLGLPTEMPEARPARPPPLPQAELL
jgi:hypothetical protein